MILVAGARPDSSGGRPPAFDPADHRGRHAVGYGRTRPERHRAVDTRQVKLAARYQALLWLHLL